MELVVSHKINSLRGPILVLGSSGFIGANLLRMLLMYRTDVYGTTRSSAWRLEGLPSSNIIKTDLLVDSNLVSLINEIQPKTIFNCISYGAYSFEEDSELIYKTNFTLTEKLLKLLSPRSISCYVHSGSSSEYGDNSAGPSESELLLPNSDYAVSKVASANLIRFYGKKKRFPCANLRLYSVYGPMEDSARLIPAVIRQGLNNSYPDFVSPDISRDFVYVEDVCEAFIDTALQLKEEDYGESFNIGTGVNTTISEVAQFSKQTFDIKHDPSYYMSNRKWDVSNWFANPRKAKEKLGWVAKTNFRDGMNRTISWFRTLDNKENYLNASKLGTEDNQYSISAIIACYKDELAIPIMYERLTTTFKELNIDYEIIFVNDNSPDNSAEVIRNITQSDRKVIGISHSRNFGSQAAFRSGMEIASKNACVLLDGDLQDPPELISQFMVKWREGYEVVYGERIKREAPFLMKIAYKLFYRLFDYFSYLSIPKDAGDFSLLDKKVVHHIKKFPERDLFLRGIRAYVGFRQIGVKYIRPERMFGKSTNNLFKNINWAKKGILSFSNTLLNLLSFVGTLMFVLSIVLGAAQILSRLLYPDLAPKGLTTVLLLVMFFGSINLLAIGLLGEYIAKIFEEVKQRPLFIRNHIIKNGDIIDATTET